MSFRLCWHTHTHTRMRHSDEYKAEWRGKTRHRSGDKTLRCSGKESLKKEGGPYRCALGALIGRKIQHTKAAALGQAWLPDAPWWLFTFWCYIGDSCYAEAQRKIQIFQYVYICIFPPERADCCHLVKREKSKTPKLQYLIWQWGWKKSDEATEKSTAALFKQKWVFPLFYAKEKYSGSSARPTCKQKNNLNSTRRFVIRLGNVLRFRCRISLRIGCPHFDLPASYLPACTKAERLNLPREGTRRDKRRLHRDAYCPAIIPPPQTGRRRRGR